MKLDIYMHMDSLITTSPHSTVPTGENTPVPGLKSGSQTPAPVTKVLRWKDLEAAVAHGQRGTPGIESPFTLPRSGLEDLETRSNGDESDIEDLFV